MGLGPEGGGVDYLAARYVGSARIKAAQGDLCAAAERLDAGMEAAEQLQLPRLAAAINNERIRIGNSRPAGGGSAPAIRADHSARRRYRHDNR